eukprot:932191_1
MRRYLVSKYFYLMAWLFCDSLLLVLNVTDILLGVGWIKFPQSVLDSQIKESQKRTNIQLSTMPFILNDSNAIIHGDELFFKIWKASNDYVMKSKYGNRKAFVVFLITLMTVLWSFIARMYYNQPVFGDNSWTMVTFHVCVAVNTFFNTFASLVFMLLTWIDTRRRLFVLERWTAMLCPKKNVQNRIKDGDIDTDIALRYVRFNESLVIKQLNMHNFGDIYHWHQGFIVIKDFGERWYRRLQADI